jgi:hypothetical protein
LVLVLSDGKCLRSQFRTNFEHLTVLQNRLWNRFSGQKLYTDHVNKHYTNKNMKDIDKYSTAKWSKIIMTFDIAKKNLNIYLILQGELQNMMNHQSYLKEKIPSSTNL